MHACNATLPGFYKRIYSHDSEHMKIASCDLCPLTRKNFNEDEKNIKKRVFEFFNKYVQLIISEESNKLGKLN